MHDEGPSIDGTHTSPGGGTEARESPPDGPSPSLPPGNDEDAGGGKGSGAVTLGDDPANAAPRKLGTYLGVYRPTLLTILGVIMYVRQGWIVGHAGLFGAILILAMTFMITGSVALSISSITTNIRLKEGGVFAIVSQSLGLEAGGAIGVPLFLAQSLSAALYIYGFAEGWTFIFPEHNTKLAALGIFLAGFILSLISEQLVLRLQVIVLLGVLIALASMLAGFRTADVLYQPMVWGDFTAGTLFDLFAVYFPAGTGIMVATSLSGKLKEPRKSIPMGVLFAWGSALSIYLILMVWYAVIAPVDALKNDYAIGIKSAAWPPGVLIGLLSSCTSAMLSTMVAAPNILAALGKYRIIPHGAFLNRTTANGTPRNAVAINGLIILCALLLGNLNQIATLITMFFLITYATINIVVLVEQSLDLISFRPTFQIPHWVPLFGSIAAVTAMIITAPSFGLLSLSLIGALYLYLSRRNLDTPWETVSSGIAIALADWAARNTQQFQGTTKRAWKPDLLIPIEDPAVLEGDFRLLRSLTHPKGSIQVLIVARDGRGGGLPPPGVSDDDTKTCSATELPYYQDVQEVLQELRSEGLFATCAALRAPTLADGARVGAAVLSGGFFPPNILYVNARNRDSASLNALRAVAVRRKIGCTILLPHPVAGMGRERAVNVWIRDQSPNWTVGIRIANIDLAILLGYQIHRHWKGRMRVLTIVEKPEHLDAASAFLTRLYEDARIVGRSESWVRAGHFTEELAHAPHADLNIFGMPTHLDADALHRLVTATRSSCLFVLDSGNESILA